MTCTLRALLIGSSVALLACSASSSVEPADTADGGPDVVETIDDATTQDVAGEEDLTGVPTALRVAQYNIAFLNADRLFPEVVPQIRAAVGVVGKAAPDVLAINEFQVEVGPGQGSGTARFDDPNATRVAELLGEGGDPYGYTVGVIGNHATEWAGYVPGEQDAYFAQRSTNAGTVGRIGYAVISRYPIVQDGVRVLVDFAWTDLPGSRVAELEAAEGVAVPTGYPLFGNALAIVPIEAAGHVIYLVCLHTTPPVGNVIKKYRNRDQLHALRLFIEGALPGVEPLPDGARFVLLGDFNADPDHGDAFPDAINALLDHPAVLRFVPEGAGTEGVHPERNTFTSACPGDAGTDPSAGKQFQLDYLLPSAAFGAIRDGGMFFPDPPSEPEDWALACTASDHMMLWAELSLR